MVFQEPEQEKVWYSKGGRPSRPSDVTETRVNGSEHFMNNSHTVSYHTKWRPLLYRSRSRQPRQAIASAQYSNSKCVSQLRATLYKQMNSIFCLHSPVGLNTRQATTEVCSAVKTSTTQCPFHTKRNHTRKYSTMILKENSHQ